MGIFTSRNRKGFTLATTIWSVIIIGALVPALMSILFSSEKQASNRLTTANIYGIQKSLSPYASEALSIDYTAPSQLISKFSTESLKITCSTNKLTLTFISSSGNESKPVSFSPLESCIIEEIENEKLYKLTVKSYGSFLSFPFSTQSYSFF